MTQPKKVVLDTDIGDDIDDALALALICASPELKLEAVTTVFGNVTARARQARTVLCACGKKFRDIPVAAGCGGTMASRTVAADGLKMYLEHELPNQDGSCLPETELAPLDPRHGIDLLVELFMRGNGDIIPITIGAMTNLAMAMVKEPRICAKIPRIVAMAAEFHSGFAEWNIRCDPEAASIVFKSGIPIDVTPFLIGKIVQFDESHVARLNAGAGLAAKNLSKAISLHQERNSRPGHKIMPSLYDPMAVATMIQPDLCTWKQGTVTVELQGDKTYAVTTFQEHSDGPHRVAWTADKERSLQFYLDRVLAL